MSENIVVNRKIDVAGLKVDSITKAEFLKQAAERIRNHEKTFVVTPYSEFLYASSRDPNVRSLLNSADYSLVDGVGVMWAHLFLTVPLTWPGFFLKLVQAWLQVVWTGASVLLYPKLIYKDFPEKIVGADLIWNLAQMAAANEFSVYLLGSMGDVAERAAAKLKEQFPNLIVAGTSNKNPDDESIIADLNAAKPDIVFVTYFPPVQEQWIADNLSKTPASLAIGLGGTFDYIAGEKSKPPQVIRNIGLEWFYRLITQPTRFKRIFRGFGGLILGMVRVKVFGTMPLRKNACAVVVNKENKVLICERALHNRFGEVHKDYWQFPQGGLDENEDVITGAKRELAEETGITSVEVIDVAKYQNEYVWNNAYNSLLRPQKFRFKGQKQSTVFLRFVGEESEIQLDKTELVNYRWVDIDEAPQLVNPIRQEHAKVVLAELKQLSV